MFLQVSTTNGMVDNPCLSLDNSGSHTDWTADFANSRCSRTVDNSYGANWKVGWKVMSHGWYGFSAGHIFHSGIDVSQCHWWSGITVAGPVNAYAPWTSALYCTRYARTCAGGGTLDGTNCSKIDTEYKNFSDI
jgi:hypothetical protein